MQKLRVWVWYVLRVVELFEGFVIGFPNLAPICFKRPNPKFTWLSGTLAEAWRILDNPFITFLPMFCSTTSLLFTAFLRRKMIVLFSTLAVFSYEKGNSLNQSLVIIKFWRRKVPGLNCYCQICINKTIILGIRLFFRLIVCEKLCLKRCVCPVKCQIVSLEFNDR